MQDIEAFLAVIEAGSQTAAARRLGRSQQSVNRSLAALERSVGVELVRRTTRQSFATEAGAAFYRRVKPAVAEISEARLEAASRRIRPSGQLRIAAPVLFGTTYLVPAIADFIARYPKMEADLKLSDRPIDLVRERFDLAVRIRRLSELDAESPAAGGAARRRLRRAKLFCASWATASSGGAGRPSMRPAQHRRGNGNVAISH